MFIATFYQFGIAKKLIGKHIPSEEWDEIIYPFQNFNFCTAKVLEWISNFIYTL